MQDNWFVMATECHLMGNLDHLLYFKKLERMLGGMPALIKAWIGPDANPDDLPKEWRAENLIKDLDEGGVTVAFGLRESMMDATGWAACFSTNGWVMQEIANYPNRLYLEANVGPIMHRGVENAIEELEYLVNERDLRLCKVYASEDGYLNDERMWPFYQKAVDLGVVLTMHTGMSYCRGQASKYTMPALLDDVLNAFPDLKVIAYHLAWPYQSELFGLANKHPNLYLGLSGTIGWFTWAPYRGYHMIGEAIQWAGVDHIVFGLDWPVVNVRNCVDYIKNLEMPEELITNWGYKRITEEDRRKILGLNLARLLNYDVQARKFGPRP